MAAPAILSRSSARSGVSGIAFTGRPNRSAVLYRVLEGAAPSDQRLVRPGKSTDRVSQNLARARGKHDVLRLDAEFPGQALPQGRVGYPRIPRIKPGLIERTTKRTEGRRPRSQGVLVAADTNLIQIGRRGNSGRAGLRGGQRLATASGDQGERKRSMFLPTPACS